MAHTLARYAAPPTNMLFTGHAFASKHHQLPTHPNNNGHSPSISGAALLQPFRTSASRATRPLFDPSRFSTTEKANDCCEKASRRRWPPSSARDQVNDSSSQSIADAKPNKVYQTALKGRKHCHIPSINLSAAILQALTLSFFFLLALSSCRLHFHPWDRALAYLPHSNRHASSDAGHSALSEPAKPAQPITGRGSLGKSRN